MSQLDDFFSSIQNEIEGDQKVKDEIYSLVKEIDISTRKITTHLQIIHQTSDRERINPYINQCRDIVNNEIKKGFEKLSNLLINKSSCKYQDQWRSVTRNLIYGLALIEFLDTGEFLSFQQAAAILNLKTESDQGVALDIDDYLIGLLCLASELARLAVNSVTNGDYQKPLEISKFVTELNAGFRLLTLKNDLLRKKYDGLKYDVKKIEEVVYDLTIRKLIPE